MTVPTRIEFHFRRAGKVVAFADVVYGDFRIPGFKIIEGTDGRGLWVGMPSKKYTTRDGQAEEWVNVAWIPDESRRKAFQEFVLAAYTKELREHEPAAA